jgi:hypothetical protein
LLGVVCLRAVVAHIPVIIPIGVGLTGIGILRAVVLGIGNAITIFVVTSGVFTVVTTSGIGRDVIRMVFITQITDSVPVVVIRTAIEAWWIAWWNNWWIACA